MEPIPFTNSVRHRKTKQRFFAICLLVFVLCPMALAQHHDRLAAPIDGRKLVTLHGSRNPRIQALPDEGILEPATRTIRRLVLHDPPERDRRRKYDHYGLSINGVDYTSSLTAFFNSLSLFANGTLTASLRARGLDVPASYVFVFSGVDPGGQKWTRQLTVSFVARGEADLQSEAPAFDTNGGRRSPSLLAKPARPPCR